MLGELASSWELWAGFLAGGVSGALWAGRKRRNSGIERRVTPADIVLSRPKENNAAGSGTTGSGRNDATTGDGGRNLLFELLERFPAPAFVKSEEGFYRAVNPAFVEWFELTGAEIVGNRDRDLMQEPLATFLLAGDRDVLRHNGDARERIEFTLPSGAFRTVEILRFTVPDPKGGKGIAGLVFDTTAHTLDMYDLTESKRVAEIANRSKSEFLANMSHELRTPLNAVIGFSEIIKNQLLGPVGQDRYVEYGNDIHVSATHLLGLINDILDLSKIEAGREDLAEETVQLPSLINSAVTMVKSRAHESGVALTTSIIDNPPTLIVDRRKMMQILVNLMTNAIKFTPKGGRVELRAVNDDGDGGLKLQVADTGVGIAEEDIPRALAPFTQLDRQLSRKQEGTGLGLPLTKRMVEMHDGTLAVVSALGEGTTITVRLPMNRCSWPDQSTDMPETAGEVRAPLFGTG